MDKSVKPHLFVFEFRCFRSCCHRCIKLIISWKNNSIELTELQCGTVTGRHHCNKSISKMCSLLPCRQCKVTHGHNMWHEHQHKNIRTKTDSVLGASRVSTGDQLLYVAQHNPPILKPVLFQIPKPNLRSQQEDSVIKSSNELKIFHF